jgi:glycerol kinase
MAPRFVAAIDHGTTSTRCILFTRDGTPAAIGQREQTMYYPRPGWVELDMDEVWQRTRECIHEALATAGAAAADVAAIGIANERETVALWDRSTGRAVARSITWQDTRTAAAAEALAADGGIDRFRARTGLPISTYSSALKLQWLLDQEASWRAAAERGDLLFGTPDTWLLWNLTGGRDGGVHATDPTNASRTLLMDLRTLRWDDELLDATRIPRALLPEIRSSSDVYGTAVGDLAGVPVAGILGDQPASLFGHTCFEHGDTKNTYGTGAGRCRDHGDRRRVRRRSGDRVLVRPRRAPRELHDHAPLAARHGRGGARAGRRRMAPANRSDDGPRRLQARIRRRVAVKERREPALWRRAAE